MLEVTTLILSAPFGTFTEINVYPGFSMLNNYERSNGAYYMEYLLESMDDEGCAERDQEIVKNVLMEAFDDADEWIKPWLVFNEKRMKHIGLQKLDIEFCCDFDPEYDEVKYWDEWEKKIKNRARHFEAIFPTVIDGFLKERVDRWNDTGRQCITSKQHKNSYSVTWSLQV